ncbi:MAG: hypothetical protein KBC96_11070 [Armatimonadetes bacterium]|nr:hypothetical protein [Armatimonadota bacterium]
MCRRLIELMVLTALVLGLGASAMAVIIPADSKYVQSLDGMWRFKLEQALPDAAERAKSNGYRPPVITPETFEPFYALEYKEDDSWRDLAVPANWEMPGFSPATYNEPDNASGFYRKSFVVPADWKGRMVLVNFDGVQCGAEVWLNGQPVHVTEPSWGRRNYHESGWTAWQADLTPAVKFGEKNLLALRVTKNTRSSNLDSGDYFFLGGIHRTVTLYSVPKKHIRDLAVRTKLLEGGKAEVEVSVSVCCPGTVSMRLGSLSPVKGVSRRGEDIRLSQVVSKPRLWSAEHPNLYPLTVRLLDERGKAAETVTRRIGIREVEIRDGILLVNRVPVKMTGVCRHDVYLSKGTAVGETVWKKDLALMKAANINTVRTSHYPYGAGFYDLCDEMGFYVVDELPYCWGDTKNVELQPAFLQRARETIARDKNHPCIVMWGIGNENGSGPNLQAVADLVKTIEPTRPRLVSCKKADEYGVEMDDAHYTVPAEILKSAQDTDRRAKWPMMYTECPNVWDIRMGADAGCLDLWAQVLLRTWEPIWSHDTIPGGCLWEWQDRAVCDKSPTKMYHYDPVTGVQFLKTKGLVDGWRHLRPDLYHVKMVYSPISVAKEVDLKSKPGYAVLDVINRYSFTDLSEINADWKLLKGKTVLKSGTAHLKLPARSGGKVGLQLPANWRASQPTSLRIDFDHPKNGNVVSCEFPLAAGSQPAIVSALPSEYDGLTLNLVVNWTRGDKQWWKVIDRYRGSLINIKTDTGRALDADIVLDKDPTAVVGRVHVEYERERFSYKVDWTGEKADIQELGWAFEMPEDFDRFSWDRRSLWSVYPDDHIGRPHGTALPDSADVRITNWSRPDAFDFNSTKYDCNWASLTNKAGHGLLAVFDTDQRHQCKGGFGEKGGYELIVNKQCSPPRDISSNSVPDLYLELKPGDSVEGSFRIGSK